MLWGYRTTAAILVAQPSKSGNRGTRIPQTLAQRYLEHPQAWPGRIPNESQINLE